jgi:polysaccharide export outer membrane protein
VSIFTTGTQFATQVREPAVEIRGNKQPSAYVLGPGDEITIFAAHAEELSSRTYRIPVNGDLNLPNKVGHIQATGKTTDELAAEVTARLTLIIKKPEVQVSVAQYKSQTVTILGDAGQQGVIPLEGRKSLIEILAKIGLKPESTRVIILRRNDAGAIPLPSAISDGEFSSAEVKIVNSNLANPLENIPILANDVINVPRGELVYVIGEVKKSGGFFLNEQRTISVLTLLARAEGTLPTAAKKGTKIIRQVPGSNALEIPINLTDVYKGKSDATLQANDILYVPGSFAKDTAKRTVDNIIQMAVGVAIFHY